MSPNLARIGLSAAAGVCAVAFAADNGSRECASMSLMKMLVADDQSAKECEKTKAVVHRSRWFAPQSSVGGCSRITHLYHNSSSS